MLGQEGGAASGHERDGEWRLDVCLGGGAIHKAPVHVSASEVSGRDVLELPILDDDRHGEVVLAGGPRDGAMAQDLAADGNTGRRCPVAEIDDVTKGHRLHSPGGSAFRGVDELRDLGGRGALFVAPVVPDVVVDVVASLDDFVESAQVVAVAVRAQHEIEAVCGLDADAGEVGGDFAGSLAVSSQDP